MVYFVQIPDESPMNMEIREFLESVEDDWRHHEVKLTTSTYFPNMTREYVNDNLWLKEAIPVGSLEFVHSFLYVVHGIEMMNAIEVPECLRLPHILMRDYKIVPFDKLPREGRHFVKCVTGLKRGTYSGSMKTILDNPDSYSLDPSSLYQVSDELDIESEYRVIVMDDEIYGIQFYDGDPTIMPTPNEIRKIKEMVLRYSMAKNVPKAYTLDVAIINTDEDDGRDIALIEVHPFVSVGTYGCRGSFLPRMYQLGIEWYVKHNDEMKPTEE